MGQDLKHVNFLFITFFISYQDANASNDLPPLLQKSSVLRAASALGIVGERQRSIPPTPHKAWIPQATTVSSLICILSSLGSTVLDGLMYTCTARNVDVAANLLQACCLAVIKPISECVCIACSRLMITSLLQVVNRLKAAFQLSVFHTYIHARKCLNSSK